MPTHDETDQFKRDYSTLTPEEKTAFKAAGKKLLEDLPSRRFRKGLRVKGVQGAKGVFELAWADDSRATFQYGEELRAGEPHVTWRRCGGHEIFKNP